MTNEAMAREYAELRGWPLVRTTAAGATFATPDGEATYVWGALPEELRWWRAQEARRLRDGLEKMRTEAQFMAASGRRVSSRRLVREVEKLLGEGSR